MCNEPSPHTPEDAGTGELTDAQIAHMVQRFLAWRLPEDFSPDNGISFKATFNEEYMASLGKPPMKHDPSGTNLFDARQAEAMVRYIVAGLPSFSPPPPASMGEGELHQRTADLVDRFAAALKEKLARAEQKYGYSDGWASADWQDECRRQLHHHAAKGDPRDVAAYAAFCWHHGWPTTTPEEQRS